ncbi:hypothetical protein EC957_008471 [Mortierella hygrophila]|uniref:Uncharacterized protein n=1 Tax=Mortierella hygrophila TaxID=979708 RepID=A0A9P6JY43_9FUNG|nr:hypothetical protein EC957_008471 [Mortierella hygrophila]
MGLNTTRSISCSRKRKFEDDTDDKDDTGGTAPAKSYGIVTNAEAWVFLQCTIDSLHYSGYNDPVFHRSDPSTTVNYFSETEKWEAAVKMTFEHIVWQLQRMVNDLSPKNKRFKHQQ